MVTPHDLSNGTQQTLNRLAKNLPPTENDLYGAIDDLLEAHFRTENYFLIKPQPTLRRPVSESPAVLDLLEKSSTTGESSFSSQEDDDEFGEAADYSFTSSSQVVLSGPGPHQVPDFSVSRVDGRGRQQGDMPFLVVEVKLSSSADFDQATYQLQLYLDYILESSPSLEQVWGILVYDDTMYFYEAHRQRFLMSGIEHYSRINYGTKAGVTQISQQLVSILNALPQHPHFDSQYSSSAVTQSLHPDAHWLAFRAADMQKHPPRYEGSWAGVTRALLRNIFGKTVVPEAVLRGPADSNARQEDVWTDIFGQSVMRKLPRPHLDEWRADFAVCEVIDSAKMLYRIWMIVETKAENSSEARAKAFDQLKRYLERAWQKLPKDMADGRMFGLIVYGGQAEFYELPPAAGRGRSRVLTPNDHYAPGKGVRRSSIRVLEYGSELFFQTLQHIASCCK
ncbi:hypothetical protein VNI00_013500 [Paramarasmius palmivorus]|uniref:Uncharacterized protein n=1 Tax=Paramarasmius palmivorus TaxID=297713 RepID=A0AAW0BWF4_9AGAR